MTKTLLFLQHDLLESEKAHSLFNKDFSHIDQIADQEGPLEIRFCPKSPNDVTVRKNFIQSSLKPLVLGQSRHILRQNALIDAFYEADGPLRTQNQLLQQEIDENKSAMSTFGYKHPKAHKFYSYLLKCLRCCYQGKFEQLNVDLNYFLLLKNELSLYFLRKEENIMATLKSAIHIMAYEANPRKWQQIEEEELAILERVLA